MHGFPDNVHVYDRLIPALRGRQVITFDFLGWGASDKPVDLCWLHRISAEHIDSSPHQLLIC